MRAMQLTLLVALVGSGLVATPAAAKTPRKLVGKVFFGSVKLMDQSPEALVKTFDAQKPEGKAGRAGDKWTTTLAAFFRNKSFPGPISVWFYDKSDKGSIKAKQAMHVLTINAAPTETLVHTIDIFGDDGFNKGRTYLLWVGQIVRKRAKIYARGELTLLP